MFLFWILCKNPGPFWVPKVNRLVFKIALKKGSQKAATKKTWTIFGSFFEHFWVHFGVHFGTRSAKEGARWAQESHQELQRAKKLHFQKPQKTSSFFVFLDPEASQENLKRPEKAPKRHPKRHPKVVQNLVKKWPKSEPKIEQKKRFPIRKKIALTGLSLGRFWGHGAFKKGLFRRCQKIVQDA